MKGVLDEGFGVEIVEFCVEERDGLEMRGRLEMVGSDGDGNSVIDDAEIFVEGLAVLKTGPTDNEGWTRNSTRDVWPS